MIKGWHRAWEKADEATELLWNYFGVLSGGTVATHPLSVVFAFRGFSYPWSTQRENIKRKIPEIILIHLKLRAVLSSMMKSLIVLLHPAGDRSYSFVQRLRTVCTACPLVTWPSQVWEPLSRYQCVGSSNPYFMSRSPDFISSLRHFIISSSKEQERWVQCDMFWETDHIHITYYSILLWLFYFTISYCW